MPQQGNTVSKEPFTGGMLRVVCVCSPPGFSEIIKSFLTLVISAPHQKGNAVTQTSGLGVTLFAVVVNGW
jgi:hypothetical protein